MSQGRSDEELGAQESLELDRLMSGRAPSTLESEEVFAAAYAAAHPRRRRLRWAIPSLAGAAATAAVVLVAFAPPDPELTSSQLQPRGTASDRQPMAPDVDVEGAGVRARLVCERPSSAGACPAGEVLRLVVERTEPRALAVAMLDRAGTLTWFWPTTSERGAEAAVRAPDQAPAEGAFTLQMTLPPDTPAGEQELFIVTSTSSLGRAEARATLDAVTDGKPGALPSTKMLFEVAGPPAAAEGGQP